MSTVNTWGAVNTWVDVRSIVAVNNGAAIVAGDQNIVIDAVKLTPNSTIQTVELDGSALPVVSWIEVSTDIFEVTVDIPFPGGTKWGTGGTLTITDDIDTLTFSSPVQVDLPTDWQQVDFNGDAPPPATTDSYYEAAQSDADIGNYTMLVDDTLFFKHPTIVDENSPVMTVDGRTVPTIEPVGTLIDQYVIWKDIAAEFTGVSTYYWINPETDTLELIYESPYENNSLMSAYPLGDAPV